MNKIKVLHVIKSLGRGGAEMLLPQTLKVHDPERFEFHYIYFLPWKNQMVEDIRKGGAQVICLRAHSNFGIIFKTWAVADYIREHGINIVHAHLPWAGLVARCARYLTKVPLVYTEHNEQERYHPITKFLNRVTFDRQDLVVAVSDAVSRSIFRNIRVSIPVKTVTNGVDPDYFKKNLFNSGKRTTLGFPDDALIIGTVAVFRFQKRLHEWLNIFSQLSMRYDNLRAIIVGDGPLKKELLDQRQLLGLEQKVLMPGLQTDVKEWLDCFDIYLMTSVFEGLPVALLEAMSMECAICTTDAGGISGAVEHGRSGLMASSDDLSGITQQLERLVLEKELRSKLSRNARRAVVENYGIKRMVSELETIYMSGSFKKDDTR